MIAVKIENEELIIDGKIEVGDNYPSFCCAGHDYEIVSVIDYDTDWLYWSLWGICRNPLCPDHDGRGANDVYHGVSNWVIEDFAEMLANGAPRYNLEKPRSCAIGGDK